MKFKLTIEIDSDNQDVIDNPNEVVLRSIERARKEASQMTVLRSNGSHTTRFPVTDINGNTIGDIALEMEDE